MVWVTSLRAGGGNAMIGFAMGAVPLTLVTGLVIESGRLSAAEAGAQAALSAAVWTAAVQDVIDQPAVRQAFYEHQPPDALFTVTNLSFEIDGSNAVIGTAAIRPPAGLLTLTGLASDSFTVTIRVPRPARLGLGAGGAGRSDSAIHQAEMTEPGNPL